MDTTYSTKEVANAFGVEVRNIQNHVKKLTENYHFIKTQSNALGRRTTQITREGVEELASIVQTKEARSFVTRLAVQSSFNDPTKAIFWQKLTNTNKIAIDYLKKSLGEEKTKVSQLENQNKELATRDLKVQTKKEYKWKEKVVRADLQRAINAYVMEHYYINSFPKACRVAKEAYRRNTNKNLPRRSDQASLHQLKSYLDWLSKLPVAE